MGSVTFYHNGSDNRCLFKSLTQITNGSYTCHFKDDSSIMTPEIILSSNANIFGANYCKIDEFDRYYYIKDVIVSQQHIVVKLEEDVLMSNATEILNMKGYVRRTGDPKKFNTYITDKKYTIQNNKIPVIRAYSASNPLGYSGPNGWVLAVAAGNTELPS